MLTTLVWNIQWGLAFLHAGKQEIRDARLLSLFDFLNLQNMIILNYYQRALFIHVHFSIFQQSILQDKISRNKYIKGSCKTSN